MTQPYRATETSDYKRKCGCQVGTGLTVHAAQIQVNSYCNDPGKGPGHMKPTLHKPKPTVEVAGGKKPLKP